MSEENEQNEQSSTNAQSEAQNTSQPLKDGDVEAVSGGHVEWTFIPQIKRSWKERESKKES